MLELVPYNQFYDLQKHVENIRAQHAIALEEKQAEINHLEGEISNLKNRFDSLVKLFSPIIHPLDQRKLKEIHS